MRDWARGSQKSFSALKTSSVLVHRKGNNFEITLEETKNEFQVNLVIQGAILENEEGVIVGRLKYHNIVTVGNPEITI